MRLTRHERLDTPQGWTLTPIREVAPLQRGFDLPASQLHSGSYPVVYSNGIVQHHNRPMANGPGVATGRSGIIGKIHFIETDYWPHNTTLWVTSFCNNHPKFIYYLYVYTRLARFLAGSGVPTLNRNDVHRHLVQVPPLLEQRAIAEALSDVGGLLHALETLIAKKQAIKQAAVQQLLTGKARLPGFDRKWRTVSLGEVSEIASGATPNTMNAAYWDGTVPWCTPTDITSTQGKYLTATNRNITAVGLANCPASLLPVGALLLCTRATIGEARIATFAVCTNQGFKSLIPKNCISNEFLYYLLVTLKPRLIRLANGSTFGEIGKRDIASIEMTLPLLDEQRAIADVLSDMDAEIAALERRVDKTRAVKQGVMQQLLTGRVRLVERQVTATP